MNWVSLTSIMIGLIALGWTLVMYRRIPDWRIALLALISVLLLTYQVVSMNGTDSLEGELFSFQSDSDWLLASGLMLVMVFVVGSITSEHLSTRRRLTKEEQAFKSLYEHNPNAVYTLDLQGRLLASNPACKKVLGYEESDFVEGSPLRVLRSDESDKIKAHFFAAVNGVPRNYETTLYHKEGHLINVHLTHVPIFVEGEVTGMYIIVKDITERKQADRERNRSNRKYQGLVESIDAIVWEGDPYTFRYQFVSPQSAKILGYRPEQLIESESFWRSVIHPDDCERLLTFCKQEIAELRNHEIEYRVFAADGRTVWIKDYVTVLDENGTVTGCRGIMVDITERKLTEERLQYIAYYDVLTNLPNRALFEERLQEEMEKARANSQMLSVLFLDVDRFKSINDTLGHSVGDELIRAVAERLKVCMREEDTICRIGGDAFALILPDLNSPQGAIQMARTLLQTLAAPFVLMSNELFVTCSIGISFFPDDGSDLFTLLKNAETAMYRTKERGRNNFQLYTTSMNEDSMQKLSLEGFLRKALGLQEFVLFYQPQVNVSSGEIIGVEALLRWKHPVLGMVSPASFIPLAEETGLIVPIGEWVLRTACEQIKIWHEAGYPDLIVAVNLSARQFLQEDLVEMVQRVLEETGVDAEFLELEITESVTMHNVERAIVVLNELRNLGIRISLDDFGTGYSSLSYLKHFPIHTLKIDQSFVRDITTDADDAAIASSVIALALSLNLHVIAEGVETEDHLRYLAERGCYDMQGYHFSRPLPAQDVEQLFVRGKLFKTEVVPPLSDEDRRKK